MNTKTKSRDSSRLLQAIHEIRQLEFPRVITVRLPATCHGLLMESAAAARLSLNDYCLTLLCAAHEELLVGLAGRRPTLDPRPTEATP